jgi:hypothetical protein
VKSLSSARTLTTQRQRRRCIVCRTLYRGRQSCRGWNAPPALDDNFSSSEMRSRAGDVLASAGDVLANAGGVLASAGGVLASAGDVLASAGDVLASAGDVWARAGGSCFVRPGGHDPGLKRIGTVLLSVYLGGADRRVSRTRARRKAGGTRSGRRGAGARRGIARIAPRSYEPTLLGDARRHPPPRSSVQPARVVARRSHGSRGHACVRVSPR